jgi:hypothetical protein
MQIEREIGGAQLIHICLRRAGRALLRKTTKKGRDARFGRWITKRHHKYKHWTCVPMVCVCVHCRMYGVCFIRAALFVVPSKEWNLINNHRARAAIWKESRARYCFFIWYYEIHYVNFYYFGSGGGRKGWKRSRWCVLPVVLYMANLNIAQQYMHARLMIYWERVVHSRITIQICNIQHFSSSIHATRRLHIKATGCSFYWNQHEKRCSIKTNSKRGYMRVFDAKCRSSLTHRWINKTLVNVILQHAFVGCCSM